MLRSHDVEVDRSDGGNPVYHFSFDVDAESVREMLRERGVKSGPLEVDYAARMAWGNLMDGFEGALGEVCEDMTGEGDSWDLLDEARTTHVVYDEEDFWLALERDGDPSLRTEGFLMFKDPDVRRAVLGCARMYPSFEIAGEDGTSLVRWRDFYFANFVLASIVEDRYEDRFGERIRVPVLESEVSVPVRGDLLRGMRDELRVILDDAGDGALRGDLIELDEAGLFDVGRLGEFVSLLDAVLSVDGVDGMKFVLEGWHVRAPEDGDDVSMGVRGVGEALDGVADDSGIPF